MASGDTFVGCGNAPYGGASRGLRGPAAEAEGGEAAEAELLRGAPPGLLGQVWVFSRVLAEEELAGLHGTTRHQYALAAAAEAEAEAEGGDVPARGSVSLSL